jgi:hypothetical protein
MTTQPLLLSRPEFVNGNVLFLAKKNHYGNIFIPDIHNTFGLDTNFFERVKIESGCNTHILPVINNQHLLDLTGFYPANDYIWIVTLGNGVSAKSIVLKISSRRRHQKIVCGIGANLGASPFEMDYVRYYLCGDDIRYMVNDIASGESSRFHNFFNQKSRNTLIANAASVALRRRHALLGQSLLTTHPSLDQNDYLFLFSSTGINSSFVNTLNSLNFYLELDLATDQVWSGATNEVFEDLEDEDILDAYSPDRSEVDEGDVADLSEQEDEQSVGAKGKFEEAVQDEKN